MQTLILAVFDFLARVRQHLRPSDKQFEPLFEIALQQELYALLLSWLKQGPAGVPLRKEAVETTAQIISWAIFGPAAQWSRGEQTISAEEMALHVLTVVIAGLSPVVTVT